MPLHWIEDDGRTQVTGKIGVLGVHYFITTDPELTPPFIIYADVKGPKAVFGDPFTFMLRFVPEGKAVTYNDASLYQEWVKYPATEPYYSYEYKLPTALTEEDMIAAVEADFAALKARVQVVEQWLKEQEQARCTAQ